MWFFKCQKPRCVFKSHTSWLPAMTGLAEQSSPFILFEKIYKYCDFSAGVSQVPLLLVLLRLRWGQGWRWKVPFVNEQKEFLFREHLLPSLFWITSPYQALSWLVSIINVPKIHRESLFTIRTFQIHLKDSGHQLRYVFGGEALLHEAMLWHQLGVLWFNSLLTLSTQR